MARKRLPETEAALEVTCPVEWCQAIPGWPCESKHGNTVRPHTARRDHSRTGVKSNNGASSPAESEKSSSDIADAVMLQVTRVADIKQRARAQASTDDLLLMVDDLASSLATVLSLIGRKVAQTDEELETYKDRLAEIQKMANGIQKDE